MKQRQAQKSLYVRLGSRDGIHELSSRLYAAHAANQQIGHMFTHVDQGPFVEHVTNFLVANSGGGGTYEGRSMAQVHEHLNITNSDFLSAGGDVQSVMKGLGHGDEEVQEAVCFLVSFVPQVVKS
jgi:truncated hemoglobin YjbI